VLKKRRGPSSRWRSFLLPALLDLARNENREHGDDCEDETYGVCVVHCCPQCRGRESRGLDSVSLGRVNRAGVRCCRVFEGQENMSRGSHLPGQNASQNKAKDELP